MTVPGFKVKVSVIIHADNLARDNVAKLKKEYIKALKKKIDKLNEEYRRLLDGGKVAEDT